jgi:hypothetical protein
MFTKQYLSEYLAEKIEEEKKNKYPSPMAVEAGIYRASYDSAYERYVSLAQASGSLITALKQMEYGDLSEEVRLSMHSLHFLLAEDFLNKLVSNQ